MTMTDIPPPTPDDMVRDLAALYLSLTKSKTIPRQKLMGAIRRCHATEAERDRLRAAAEFVLAKDHSPETYSEAIDGLREELNRNITVEVRTT
jgi:hypothetical protein